MEINRTNFFQEKKKHEEIWKTQTSESLFLNNLFRDAMRTPFNQDIGNSWAQQKENRTGRPQKRNISSDPGG